LYAFIASTLTPLLDARDAALATNLIAWAISAFCAWRLSMRLFNDAVAAFIAVVLVASGMGFVVHVSDFSAHLASYASYYLGIVILFESDIWRPPGRPFKEHLVIGIVLALCCLTYNSGVALVAAYLVLAIRHNRIVHVGSAALVGLTAPYFWVGILNLGYALKTGQWAWYNLYSNEQSYLAASIQTWIDLWVHPLRGFLETVHILAEFLSFDSPLTVAVGLIALLLLFRTSSSVALVLSVLLLLPIAGAMAYAQQAAARGYLVYGVSLIVYVAAGGLLCAGMRHRISVVRSLAVAVTLVLVAGQVAWSSAHFVGYLGPLRAYYNGGDKAYDWFNIKPVKVASLTGQEPQPAWFGGLAPFERLGLFKAAGPERSDSGLARRIFTALSARLLPSAYLVALIAIYLMAFPIRWRIASVLVAAVYVLPSLAAAVASTRIDRFVPIDGAGVSGPCSRLRYSVRLSDDLLKSVASFDPARASLRLYFRPVGNHAQPPNVSRSGHPMAVQRTDNEGVWNLDLAQWQQMPTSAQLLELTYTYDGEVRYLGWQRTGLPGRELALEGCAVGSAAPEVVPALELRVVNGGDAPLMVGF
jgi:hypothetical protein